MKLASKISTAIDEFKRGGLTAVAAKTVQTARRINNRRLERNWITKYGSLNDEARHRIIEDISLMPRKPKLSIVMPVYNVDEIWLRKCIDSVRGQIYQDWELCVADDCSPKPHIKTVLEEYSRRDPRIKVIFRKENGHISAASNSALEIATGEFCILLDHDDELSEDAAYRVAREIIEYPDVAMIYSDEDMIDDKGHRFDLKFKPDFSLDLLRSLNLVTHLSAYRTDALRKIGGFRVGLEGSQDYDLALRVIDVIDADQIRHIPHVLYHWRAIPGSVALSGDEKPYAHDRARTAIKEHLERRGVQAEVEQTHFNLHRVRYKLPSELPSVSILIFGAADERIGQLREAWRDATEYPDLEIIGVSSSNNIASELNRAAAIASGKVLCFADSSIMPVSEDWLKEMVSVAVEPDVGAVGGKIIDVNDRVVDGAIVFGGGCMSNIAHSGYGKDDAGNMARNILIGNFSAVSMSCLAIERGLFDQAGGFDTEVSAAFIGADLNLRLGEMGKRIVFDPFVEMRLGKGFRLTRSSLPTDNKCAKFRSRWSHIIDRDPFYSPNLNPKDGQFRIKV